eukprot:9029459-Alexandrium_andersonii.AAC.1
MAFCAGDRPGNPSQRCCALRDGGQRATDQERHGVPRWTPITLRSFERRSRASNGPGMRMSSAASDS